MTYQVFERSSIRAEEPMLTVLPLPDARITLNAASSRLLQAAGVKSIKILWDGERCGIALQGAGRSDKDSYAVAFSRGRSASVSGKAFLRHIGWSCKKRRTVPATWNQKQKMLEAILPAEFVQKAQLAEGAQE